MKFGRKINFNKNQTTNEINLKLQPVTNSSTQICLMLKIRWSITLWHHCDITSWFLPDVFNNCPFFWHNSFTHLAKRLIFVKRAMWSKNMSWNFQGLLLIRTCGYLLAPSFVSSDLRSEIKSFQIKFGQYYWSILLG